MAEYISKEVAIEKTEEFCDVFVTKWTDEKVLAWIRNLPAADVIEVGSCDGCHWKGMGRFQKCTYCRRNRNLKDRFEERRTDE